METHTVPEEEPREKGETSSLFDMARKVLLASVGAVALAQDEVEEFVGRLVERGEIAEKDGKKLVNEIMDRRKRQPTWIEEEMNRRLDRALKRMNAPTKADIDALSEKIAALTQKVEELKRDRTDL